MRSLSQKSILFDRYFNEYSHVPHWYSDRVNNTPDGTRPTSLIITALASVVSSVLLSWIYDLTQSPSTSWKVLVVGIIALLIAFFVASYVEANMHLHRVKRDVSPRSMMKHPGATETRAFKKKVRLFDKSYQQFTWSFVGLGVAILLLIIFAPRLFA